MTEQGKKKTGIGSLILIIICLIVFIISAGKLIKYIWDTTSSSSSLQDLKTVDEETGDYGLAELKAKNSDFVGWLVVDGTRIDYPVMYTPDDPEFYLHRDFDKNYSTSGTPFIDALSDGKSMNRIVYGHNMKIGTMFHDLIKYDDKDFWEEHKTIEFRHFAGDEFSDASGGKYQLKNSTNGTDNQDNTDNSKTTDSNGNADEVNDIYEIIAAGYSQIYSDDSSAFKYYEYAAIYDEETFDEYIQGIKGDSYFDTGLDAEYGDQLLTLSTCAYQTDNGRFYVVAKKVGTE